MRKDVVQRSEYALFVPKTGDGNPSALQAIFQRLQEQELPIAHTEFLGISAWPARVFHRRMSQSAETANTYSDNSEGVRSGKLAQVLRRVLAAEVLSTEAKGLLTSRKRTAIFVQEMPLLGLPEKVVSRLFNRVFLAIPDVMGKMNGKLLKEAPEVWQQTTILVWNRQALEYLTGLGYPRVELVKPWYFGDKNSEANKTLTSGRVYAKSSGSGWPRQWEQAIAQTLTTYQASGQRVGSYIYSGLKDGRMRRIDSQGEIAFKRPTIKFYEDIATNIPEFLIGYPSELIMVCAELAAGGWPIKFIALPPRGQHEVSNLLWALDHGLIWGVAWEDNGKMRANQVSADLETQVADDGFRSLFWSRESTADLSVLLSNSLGQNFSSAEKLAQLQQDLGATQIAQALSPGAVN